MQSTPLPAPDLAAINDVDRPLVAEMVDFMREHGCVSYHDGGYSVVRGDTGRLEVYRRGHLITSVEG